MKAIRSNIQRGFTLLEVLVALAVIAIPLLAVMESVTTNVSNAAYLRDRTIAHWVAMNKVAEAQLDAQWPAPGQSGDKVQMSGRDWYWRMTVKVTNDPDIRRLDVEVRAHKDDKQPLESLVAYVERPR